MANPKDLIAKNVTKLHETIYRVSKGKVLNSAAGMPVLMLHHKGRKTGAERTTMLTTPLVRGDKVVLVASYGGDDRNPVWYLNLLADPNVEITIDGERRNVVARVADDEERTRLWTELTSTHKNYADYQSKTQREIPVVVLEPA